MLFKIAGGFCSGFLKNQQYHLITKFSMEYVWTNQCPCLSWSSVDSEGPNPQDYPIRGNPRQQMLKVPQNTLKQPLLSFNVLLVLSCLWPCLLPSVIVTWLTPRDEFSALDLFSRRDSEGSEGSWWILLPNGDRSTVKRHVAVAGVFPSGNEEPRYWTATIGISLALQTSRFQ